MPDPKDIAPELVEAAKELLRTSVRFEGGDGVGYRHYSECFCKKCLPAREKNIARFAHEHAAEAVKREREKFARQLTIQRDNNHERNVELDALHYVWCDGGCEGGVHRFAHRTPLTEEIVQAAERNTKRMRSWLDNHQARRIRDESEGA